MRRLLLALLLTCSTAFGATPVPMNKACVFELTLWDGAAVLTGKTVTCSVYSEANTGYWTGSAWGSYTALSMTEQTGNAHLSGKYKYSLAAGAVATVNDRITFSSTYTNGSDTILNREEFRVTLPLVYSYNGDSAVSYVNEVLGGVAGDIGGDVIGSVLDPSSIWQAATSGLTTVGSIGKLLVTNVDAKVSEAGGGSGGLSDTEHAWLQYIYGKLGAVAVTVTQFAATDGTINVTQGSDYPSGLIALSRTWPGEDLTGATCTVSVISKSGYDSGTGTVAINASSCTFTGGTTGSTLTVNVPLTHTQTAALSVSRYQYEVKITTGGGNVYRPFSGTMNVLRKVN